MSKKTEDILVGGFAFRDEEEAKRAQKELDGVKYIRSKTDMEQPEMVLQIYNKMIEENLFETAVGSAYLKELQEYLRAIPGIQNKEIRAIPIRHPAMEAEVRKERDKQQKKQKEIENKLKEAKKTANSGKRTREYRMSLWLNLILALCVVGMFIISMTSSAPTIVNYEAKLIDKYASWEQELTEREQRVKELERELEITEDVD